MVGTRARKEQSGVRLSLQGKMMSSVRPASQGEISKITETGLE